jgi:hypothetical protein
MLDSFITFPQKQTGIDAMQTYQKPFTISHSEVDE